MTEGASRDFPLKLPFSASIIAAPALSCKVDESVRVRREEPGGASAVAGQFVGRARFAQPALVNSAVGLVWAPGGQPRVVFGFTIAGGKIASIELIADPERLLQLDLTILDD